MDPVKIPRNARGPRPESWPGEPGAERLMTMVLALCTELAVVHERLDTLERLVTEKGVLTPDDLEAYVPDLGVREERERWRREYLERVLRGLLAEVPAV
jgi:hypothetical protein